MKPIIQKILKSKLLKNTSWLMASSTLTTVLTLVKAIILAKYLGPKDYGVLVLIISSVALLSKFLDFRTGETVVKYVLNFSSKKKYNAAYATLKLTTF